MTIAGPREITRLVTAGSQVAQGVGSEVAARELDEPLEHDGAVFERCRERYVADPAHWQFEIGGVVAMVVVVDGPELYAGRVPR